MFRVFEQKIFWRGGRGGTQSRGGQRLLPLPMKETWAMRRFRKLSSQAKRGIWAASRVIR